MSKKASLMMGNVFIFFSTGWMINRVKKFSQVIRITTSFPSLHQLLFLTGELALTEDLVDVVVLSTGPKKQISSGLELWGIYR
jgi:hypothetical protein